MSASNWIQNAPDFKSGMKVDGWTR